MGLDNLATNGIINFDPDAFIKGTPPKYVGSPEEPLYLPMDRPLPDMFERHGKVETGGHGAHGEVGHSPFISQMHGEKGSSSFKDFLMLALVGGVGAYLIAKRKSFSSGCKNAGENTKSFFANCKDKVTSLFKSKAAKTAVVTTTAAAVPVAQAATATEAQAVAKKGFFSKIKSSLKWSTMPKWGKITTLCTAGLLGLYGAYKALGSKTSGSEHPSPTMNSGH